MLQVKLSAATAVYREDDSVFVRQTHWLLVNRCFSWWRTGLVERARETSRHCYVLLGCHETLVSAPQKTEAPVTSVFLVYVVRWWKSKSFVPFFFFFFLPGALSFTAFFFRTSCSHLSRRIKRMILIQSFKQRVLLALFYFCFFAYTLQDDEKESEKVFFFFFNCTF